MIDCTTYNHEQAAAEKAQRRKSYCAAVIGAAYCSVKGEPEDKHGQYFSARLSALSTFALLNENDLAMYHTLNRIMFGDWEQTARVARLMNRLYMAKDAAQKAASE